MDITDSCPRPSFIDAQCGFNFVNAKDAFICYGTWAVVAVPRDAVRLQCHSLASLGIQLKYFVFLWISFTDVFGSLTSWPGQTSTSASFPSRFISDSGVSTDAGIMKEAVPQTLRPSSYLRAPLRAAAAVVAANPRGSRPAPWVL